MAECECRLGDVDAAREHIARAHALAVKVDDPHILAVCYLWEGNIHKAYGHLDDAQVAYERACAAATPLEHDEILATSLAALAGLLQARGNATLADQAYTRARKVSAGRVTFLARIREELGPHWSRLINSHA
jgi:ATP/maltotriose-dependent transcriptional regulator MalT